MLKELVSNKVFRLKILFWIFFVFNSKYLEKLLEEYLVEMLVLDEFKFRLDFVEEDDLKKELVKLKG